MNKAFFYKLGAMLVILAIAWMQYQESRQSDVTAQNPSPGGFEVLEGCRLIKHRHNDGDSFWVKTPKGDFEIRLYYVDAPESAAKTYRNGENNHKRLAQQGQAFGGLSQKKTVEVGQQAKRYTLDLLKAQEFRVATRWESVYGSPRKYGFVLVGKKGEEKYLHELLVSRGLARIHTKPMMLPDGTTIDQQKRHLSKLELEAKQKQVGAWGSR